MTASAHPSPVPSPESGAPAAPGGALSTMALLRALGRRWKAAAALGLFLAAAAATAAWFLVPPPRPAASAALIIEKVQGLLGEHPDPPMDLRTQKALIRDPYLLTAVIRPGKPAAQLGVVRRLAAEYEDPIEGLQASLSVTNPDSQQILRITFTGRHGDDPQELCTLVKEVRTEYLNQTVGERVRERQERLKKLEEMAGLPGSESGLRQQLLRLRKLVNPELLGFSSGTDKEEKVHIFRQQLIEEHFGIAKRQLLKIQEDLRSLRMREIAYRTGDFGDEESVPPDVIEREVDADPRMQALTDKLQQLNRTLKGFRKVYGEADTAPDVRAVLAQIASCREEQSTLRKELRLQKKADFLEQLRLNAKGRLAGVQEQIKYAEVLEKSLTSEVETLATQRKNYAADARAAEKYRLEIEAIETNLASLLTRIERLKMELDAPPQVRELGEEARIEPVDETARRVKFAGFGGLGGLGAGLLLVGLLELRRRRVDCPEAVGRELGLRVMGTIPRPPAGSARRAGVGTNEEWQALLAGSVDYARTMLLHTPFGTPVQLIAITSAVSGEGKTSFASHLALSLARSGRRTLLVDGDFHNPSADRLFGIADAPGLSDLLRGEGTLAEAAHPGPVEHLFVTPAGTFDAVAARALAQDALAPIFDQMRADFDVIVVDCSPVLPVADALQVARHADGVILTLLQGHSRLPDAEAARERLAALNCRVLGAVVNGTGDHMYRYGSGYRYRRQPLGSAS